MWVEPPPRTPWVLRPLRWLARRLAGKDTEPAALLSWSVKLSLGAGLFEALAASAPAQLDVRSLAVARIVASAVAGCPFCLDMNAATWSRAGLTAAELRALVANPLAPEAALGAREQLAARYAAALSQTPVEVSASLREQLAATFSSAQWVALAHAVAQVNFWSRFAQGLGVAPAGFLPTEACELPSPPAA